MPWETPEERTAIEALDASPATLDLISQPAVLEIPCEAGTFPYTPDIAVLRKTGDIWIIECKPAEILAQEEVRQKHAAIAVHLMAFEIRFIELPNEAQPSPEVRDNIDKLAGRNGPVQYPKAKREEDRTLIEAYRPTTFRRPHCASRLAVRGGRPCRRTTAF